VPTLFIVETEEYPVYSLNTESWGDGQAAIELSNAEWEEYLRVQGEFDAWQKRMSTAADKSS